MKVRSPKSVAAPEIVLPEDKTLGESTRIRLFKADETLLQEAESKTGLPAEHIKRVSVHNGLKAILQNFKPKAA